MERPIEGLCPVCEQTFPYKIRKQGGGKRPIYCSARCRSKDWARHNPEKRKATVVRYDEGHWEDKRERQRRDRVRKYGWTEADFTRQLARQGHSCYGCLAPIDRNTARIDHNHETGIVRGLLCNHCNWALGHAKDNPAILRRLMAHLDYRIDKTNVYLVGALKNARIPDVGNMLRVEGYDVMDEWFTPGEHADENWQAYERKRGRTYREALNGRAAQNIFLFDRSYLDHADVVVLVSPAGKSAMLELGYAKGRGKYTVILLDGLDPERYDIMPGFADRIVKNVAELLEVLRQFDEPIEPEPLRTREQLEGAYGHGV